MSYIREIEDDIKNSGQSPATITRLLDFLRGVADNLHTIAHNGPCAWSKGIDDYSTGLNVVANWYNERSVNNTYQEVYVDAQSAIDILGHIRYVSNNFIKDNGMKTIHELAAVGISYLGGDPHDKNNN